MTKRLKIFLLLALTVSLFSSCKPSEPSTKELAEQELLGKWDWVSTYYPSHDIMETPEDSGYYYYDILDGTSWTRYRDGNRDLQLGYSVEYSVDLPDDLSSNSELVIKRSDGYWNFDIEKDSLTITQVRYGAVIVKYVRGE